MPTSELVALVFVSGGLWVAQCPRCTNAETIGRCHDGSEGGLTGDRFTCRRSHGGCGLICEAQWPSQVDAIEALMRERPVPANRNWHPGERVIDLVAENLQHGAAVPDSIRQLAVTAAEQRRPIGA